MRLKDAPGGAELIRSLTNVVKDLALLYSDTSDDQARAHLETYVERIKPHIVAAVGADKAPVILSALRGAVMGRKHKLEAMGASRV